MNRYTDIPLCEPLDEFGWDHDEIRDLIQTTPLRFGDDGQPVGYEAEQLFGLEAAYVD
jgi:hypothetical protein